MKKLFVGEDKHCRKVCGNQMSTTLNVTFIAHFDFLQYITRTLNVF